jgi:hypothetical protein
LTQRFKTDFKMNQVTTCKLTGQTLFMVKLDLYNTRAKVLVQRGIEKS